MNHLRIAVLLQKKKKKQTKKEISNKRSCKQYKHILSLLFERRWIPHMLGAALHKIMYRQPLP